MSSAAPIQVVLTPYERSPRVHRVSVGDVIRCPDFVWGIRWRDPATPVMVAWIDTWRPHPKDYYITSGQGTLANDDTRGDASFLVTRIELQKGGAPEDMDSGLQWYARTLTAVRLDADLTFTESSETITCSMEDPMSVARANEARIEILGYAALPIEWRDPVDEA